MKNVCKRAAPRPSIYLNRVADEYSRLRRSRRVVFVNVVNARDEHVVVDFSVPRSADCDAAALLIRDRYLLAQLNNMFVTFGGARLAVYVPSGDARLLEGLREAVRRFDFERPANDRTGPGSFANYMNRINRSAGLPPFSVEWRKLEEFLPPDPRKAYRLYRCGDRAAERHLMHDAVEYLAGKNFVGLDVGGTGIKAAAVVNGEVAALYNLHWHPAMFTRVEQVVKPILGVAELMTTAASLFLKNPAHPLLAAMRECRNGVTEDDLRRRSDTAAAALGEPAHPLDGLLCGFPDIVIGDKVVGGEVYKLRGIRLRDPVGYDAAFTAVMNLDAALARYCRQDGVVAVLNDGFITSSVITFERLFSGVESRFVDECSLVHPIGTEMGTGVISPDAGEQDIPIEGYNWIIDLGCEDDVRMDIDDVRNCNNFNTDIPGTVQKIISQSGLMRLAIRNFTERAPGRIDELVAAGLLAWEKRNASESLVVPVQPRDRRSDLVRRLVAMLRDGDPCVRDAYMEMGMAMGILMEAMGPLLPDVRIDRYVSGGVIADDLGFAAFRDGLRKNFPRYDVLRLDTGIANSPLLKKLPPEDMGFMSPVGACYLAARRLLRRNGQTPKPETMSIVHDFHHKELSHDRCPEFSG